MGPALREGYWTAEDYQDPRENIHGRYRLSSSSISSSEPMESNFIFDTIPFEDELLAWEPNNEEPDKKKYYNGYTNGQGKDKEGTIVKELIDMSASKSDFTEADIDARRTTILESFYAFVESNGLMKS